MKKLTIVLIIIIVVMCFSFVVSADTYNFSNPLNLVNDTIYEYDNHYVFTYIGTDDKYYTVISNNPFAYFETSNVLRKNSPYRFEIYQYHNNTWNLYDSKSVSNFGFTADIPLYYNLVWSDYDVKYMSSSDVFFSKTVPMPYIMDNQTLLQPLRQSVTQNSQILLACGVGILSLILSVGLFRKLYLYL